MKVGKPKFEGTLRLKKGDEVVMISGRDKGKRGKIIQTVPEDGKVIIDGVNLVTRHQKPRSSTGRAVVKQQLGEMQVPLGVPSAKVMLICPKCNKETRIARVRTQDGDMARSCRKCDELIDG